MLQKDKHGRPFAFINFEKTEDAKAAIENFHSKDLRSDEDKEAFPEGKPKAESTTDKTIIPADDHPEHLCYCQRAQTKIEREGLLKGKFSKFSPVQQVGVNLYIKNLADDVDDEGLGAMFSVYGEITSAHVMMDPKCRSKGFGFVCYKAPDEATKAVTEMHLKVVKGKPLYVGLAERKDERNSRLAARYKGDAGGKGAPMTAATKGGLVTFDKGAAQMGAGQMMNPMAQQSMMKGGQMMAPQVQGQMFPPNMSMMQQRGMMVPQARGAPMMGYPMGMQQKGANPMAMQQQMKGNPAMVMQQQMKGFPPQMKGMPQMVQTQPRPPQGAPPQQQVAGRGPEQQLTAQMLANAPPGMQKQMLGEKLYPAVSRLQPDLAGKITGMMLEMDNAELLLMLDSDAQLRQKVDEAMRVLSTMNK